MNWANLLILFQAAVANITLADIVYVIGLVVTLIGLFGGFAKVVTKMSVLQSTVDSQGQTILELKADSKRMLDTIHSLEMKMIKLEK